MEGKVNGKENRDYDVYVCMQYDVVCIERGRGLVFISSRRK